VSQAVLAEIERVLIRPKFDRYISLDKRLKFIASLVARAEYINVTETIEICRDAKDNRLLELAKAGAATHLITGDQDLLVLNPFESVVIQQPADFLATVET
jgi:hypothetical protein